ncbi:hypothetical protein AMOR_13270 [Anaeromyxobacter oryzae]|uniref:Secreted protein n=1 Tax=Anaeromyxobacter oryzae TaxID=2918170 RepID=A0ABM7WS64_9BACT|nr:hypothetical protein AMOR_13270 [Anaeromyxobacter oryzae]
MSSRPRRLVRFLWPAVAAALIALWPHLALAGHTGHRVRHGGAWPQRSTGHGSRDVARRHAGGFRSPAPARSAHSRSR